jgi:clan AA aspartic protease
MIRGVVTAGRDAVIRLTVRGPTGHAHRVRAVIDTGYDGWLSLPPALIGRLGLRWRRVGFATLADGSETVFNIHEGTVVWDKKARRIPVDESGSIPLVGMALLDGYELTVRVRPGDKVTIKPLHRRTSN